MSVEHLIDILLVHVLKEFALLVSQLSCEHFLTLSAEALHVLSFVFLKHFFDVDETFLTLFKVLNLLGVVFLQLGHAASLLLILEKLELSELAISLLDRLLNVVLHLVTVLHVLHKLTEHEHLLLSLSIFKQLLLLSVSLQLEDLKLLLDSFLLVSISDLDVLVSLGFFDGNTLKSGSELIEANQALDTLLS